MAKQIGIIKLKGTIGYLSFYKTKDGICFLLSWTSFWAEILIFNLSMKNQKISIRFFNDREVRAVWDEENTKWWFSVLDFVSVLTNQNDYTKTRNYWKYLKAKLKKENNQVVSATTQFKFLAPDGKKRLADMLDYKGIIALGKTMFLTLPSKA